MQYFQEFGDDEVVFGLRPQGSYIIPDEKEGDVLVIEIFFDVVVGEDQISRLMILNI